MRVNEIHISEKIREWKLAGKCVHSNCFLRFTEEEKMWKAYDSPQSVLIVKMDHGVRRLFFYTIDFSDLKQLADRNLSASCEYILEVVAKDKTLYRDELEDMGFCVLANMSRLSTKDISPLFGDDACFAGPYDDSIVETAHMGDVRPLKQKLWEVFDTRISHLPNEDELKMSVQKGEFCLCRGGDSEIVAFLQSAVEPKSFYINQVYNGAEKKCIHSLMHKRLSDYYNNGGKYAYAWVDEKNEASLGFHKKYGMQADGLWTCVYVKQKVAAYPGLYIDEKMYMLCSGKKVLLVDAVFNEDAFQRLEEIRPEEVLIILTHEHIDHIYGVNEWRRKYPCKVLCSAKCAGGIADTKKNLARYKEVLLGDCVKSEDLAVDYVCTADITFENTYEFTWEGHMLELRETPGHSAGSICVMLDKSILFTGDSLLKDDPVITRLPGGSRKDYEDLTLPYLESLDPHVQVYPGHGGPARLEACMT